MKIALNYDVNTGQITDDSGIIIMSYMGLQNNEIKESKVSTNVTDLVKLKDAGFTAEEIISLSSREII